jgi:hypothetical protein
MDTVYVLFPSGAQLELVEELALLSPFEVCVVMPDVGDVPSTTIELLRARDLIATERRRGSRDRWHCCNEHALYFVSQNRDVAGALAFDTRCLDMLTKLQMSTKLAEADVSVLPKARLDGIPLETIVYPIVAKPNFGFASILVQRLATRDALDEYIKVYAESHAESLVPWFEQTYFRAEPAEIRQIVIEPEMVDAVFVSASLVVDSGRLRELFLVEGVKREASQTSDYQWREFRTPVALPPALFVKIRDEMQKIASRFAVRDAVFEAELLIDIVAKRVITLEFSPRIVGGFIPQLIFHSTGVPLERLAMSLALGMESEFSATSSRACSLANRTGPHPEPHGRVLETQRRYVGTRLVVDEISALDN